MKSNKRGGHDDCVPGVSFKNTAKDFGKDCADLVFVWFSFNKATNASKSHYASIKTCACIYIKLQIVKLNCWKWLYIWWWRRQWKSLNRASESTVFLVKDTVILWKWESVLWWRKGWCRISSRLRRWQKATHCGSLDGCNWYVVCTVHLHKGSMVSSPQNEA